MIKQSLHTPTSTLIAALCLALVSTVDLHAQYGETVDRRASRISPLEYVATNTGTFGYDPATRGAGLFYPRGSGRKYLLGSGLWFGARKGTRENQPLVFYTYNVNTGRSEATPGERTGGYEVAAPHLYHSVEYSQVRGSYSRPDSTPLPPWPLWRAIPELAPTMFSPGSFEPSPDRRMANVDQGTPAFAINADEQMFARYHDGDLRRYEIDSQEATMLGYPIGLQIEQNVYAWKLESRNENVVVIVYDIINQSGDTLYDCIASQAAEPDLGAFDNDHISFHGARPELRAGYIWSEPESYGDYKALGMILVEGPVTGADGLLDNTRRQDFRSSGRIGAFPSWTDRAGYDPLTHVERYRLMSEGGLAVDNGPDDYRCLLATTRFSMRPGDTAHFAVAFALIDGIPNGMSTEQLSNQELCGYYTADLDNLAEGILDSYYTVANVSATPAHSDRTLGADAVLLIPNPTYGKSAVEYSVAGPTVLRISVSNSMGERVLAFERDLDRAGIYRHDLDISTLPSGTYFVSIAAEGRTRTARLVVE